MSQANWEYPSHPSQHRIHPRDPVLTHEQGWSVAPKQMPSVPRLYPQAGPASPLHPSHHPAKQCRSHLAGVLTEASC